MALLGIYVGVIPVSLGMLWLPFLRRLGSQWMAALLAFTSACSPSSRSTPASRGWRSPPRRRPPSAAPASSSRERWSPTWSLPASTPTWNGAKRREPAARPPAGGAYLALLVAIGIGLHNLGEGLAIGSAYATGALALGAFLVVGFAIHNTTEGLAIVAPLRGGGERGRSQPRDRPPARPRPDRRRAGDPRRLDRRLRLQPEPGGAAVRRRRRRDRPGDRPDRPGDARRATAACSIRRPSPACWPASPSSTSPACWCPSDGRRGGPLAP